MNELNKWRVTVGCDLLWHFWDGEFVVFNTGSGDTHVLDVFSGEVLRSIQQQPASAAEIATCLADTLTLTAEEVPLGRITDVLAEFHILGLIEPLQ